MFRFKIVEPADIIEYYNCLNVGGHAAPQDRIRQCRCKDPWLGPPAFHFTSNFTVFPFGIMAKILDMSHKLIAGGLIVASFGGFAFISQRFWSLVQHMKVVYAPKSPDSPIASPPSPGSPKLS